MRILVAAILLSMEGAMAQQSPPAFEVADLKPSDPNNPLPAGKGRQLPGGRLEVAGITLTNMMMLAYGVQEDMIIGLPKWAGTVHYDLVAKAPPGVAESQIRPMIQTLLMDRFKLQMHREDKVRSAYVLTVGKRGSKLQEAAGGSPNCRWTNLDSGLRRRECHNMSMEELARELPAWGGVGIDLPVVDETGLKGIYDLNLDMGFAGRGADAKPGELTDTGPTVFSALDQLGLRLESRKMPISVIVVDRAEQP